MDTALRPRVAKEDPSSQRQSRAGTDRNEREPKIRGKIPAGLCGALYRNGPNPQFDPGPNYHAFLGDGMIHGFWLAEGGAHYANRYVRTPRWLTEHAAGRALFGGLGCPAIHPWKKSQRRRQHAHRVSRGQIDGAAGGLRSLRVGRSDLSSKGWVESGGRFTAHPRSIWTAARCCGSAIPGAIPP